MHKALVLPGRLGLLLLIDPNWNGGDCWGFGVERFTSWVWVVSQLYRSLQPCQYL